MCISDDNSLVTMDSDCTWYDITEHLLNRGRTITVYQSYFNFSVSGNYYSRYIQFRSIADSVVNLKIILSNCKIVFCNWNTDFELFL